MKDIEIERKICRETLTGEDTEIERKICRETSIGEDIEVELYLLVSLVFI